MFDDFYGLQARPFQLTPDPAFYFESQSHRKALSYLGYGLAQSEGFVVITGEVGSGKSTLVAFLMATIDPSRLTAAQIVTSALDGEEIIHVVAQAFGLKVSGHDKASALGAIEAFFHEEARAGRRCLLIVDEAQNLSVTALEELRMLSNFQLGAHPLLQTLLLGQPEFRETLLGSPSLEQLRQRIIATHHLTAMQANEVRPYIEHRLNHVGWSGNPEFDSALFMEIFAATGGIPRRINQVVNRLLLLGAVDRRSHIDSAMLAQVLEELREDGASTVATPLNNAPEQSGDQAAMAAGTPGTADMDMSVVSALLETALAQRDAQIDDLKQAVADLANASQQREAASIAYADARDMARLQEQFAASTAQVDRLESRLAEQERTMRHMLTMLIEWIENGESPRVAA